MITDGHDNVGLLERWSRGVMGEQSSGLPRSSLGAFLDYSAYLFLFCTVIIYFTRTGDVGAAPPLASYVCHRASTPPVIDGRLDDKIWSQVPSVGALACLGTRKGKPTYNTIAKACWDSRYIYFAFECDDPDIWSKIKKRDGYLWEGEVVEVYIDADGDGKDYKEFEVNPLNTVIDLNIPQGGDIGDVDKNLLWNAQGWLTAVHIEGTTRNRKDKDERWTVEMAIPIGSFKSAKRLPPKDGDVWRCQLFRIDRSNTLQEPEYSSWSVTDTFHNPSRFGRFVFRDGP